MTDYSDHRFAFGQNWHRYLASVGDAQITAAGESLKDLLGVDDLTGKRFLDIGCGSGVFSLAARHLGAAVHSFDYDDDSVACTTALRDQDGSEDGWRVEQGSVLDHDYLVSLGRFDIVYAWGVLHHTGELRQAMENTALTVARGGMLVVAIYNDQGWISSYWLTVKRLYNSNPIARTAVVVFHLPYLFAARALVRKELAAVSIEPAGPGEVGVRGTWEELQVARSLIERGRRPAGSLTSPRFPPLARRRFTLKVARGRVSDIMKQLGQTGVRFVYDTKALEAAGIRLDRTVALDVQKVTAEEFFDRLFTPLGLEFTVDGVTVRLSVKREQ